MSDRNLEFDWPTLEHPSGARVRLVCDSISPDGVRLTTMEVKMARFILAEYNTHRVMSRNSSSSRAIPVAKMLKTIREDPFVFDTFFRNQKGMAVVEPLPETIDRKSVV